MVTFFMVKAGAGLPCPLQHPSVPMRDPKHRGNSPICSWWLEGTRDRRDPGGS